MAYLTQWDTMGWKIKFMTGRTGPSLVVLLMYQVPFVPCISLYPQGIWRIQFNIGDACLFPPNVAYCANIEANLSAGFNDLEAFHGPYHTFIVHVTTQVLAVVTFTPPYAAECLADSSDHCKTKVIKWYKMIISMISGMKTLKKPHASDMKP
jgi:hypothetical protein